MHLRLAGWWARVEVANMAWRPGRLCGPVQARQSGARMGLRTKTALAVLTAMLLTGGGAADGVVGAAGTSHRLVILSVDGLDWRYLRDRDALGLKIPNIRRLLAKSQVADGVTGVWPTITWPSHTTMLTGVRPDQHGILANAGGPPDPALSTWSATQIKATT